MADLVKLNYAVAVAEEGNYRLAAERLSLSQPALSRAIQSLESEYGLRIFERGRSGARLTSAGAEFIALAQALLQRAASLDEQLRSVQAGRIVPVSFGMGAVTAATILPGILPKLASDGTRLRVRIESLMMLQQLLRHREIDFFVSGVPVGHGFSRAAGDLNIRRIPLSSLDLLVRRGHPLLSHTPTAEEISQYPVASGGFLRELLSPARLARTGLQLPSVEADDYVSLASLAMASDFILIGSRGLLRARPEFQLFPLSVNLSVDDVEWGLVTSGSEHLSPPANRVAELVLTALANALGSEPL